MNKTLIENGLIITVDDKDSIYHKGYILVNQDTIEEIGDGSYTGDLTGVTRFDASGHAVMPGICQRPYTCCRLYFQRAFGG